MAQEQFVVISYDIHLDKRRLKVAKLLLDYGSERVQYSVFEVYITPSHLEKLKQRLRKIIKEEEDSVRFYFLCQACRPRIEYVGQAKAIDEPGLLII
jgi:CRISPR-associated protein Cas2